MAWDATLRIRLPVFESQHYFQLQVPVIVQHVNGPPVVESLEASGDGSSGSVTHVESLS